jgi:hypothetical protein
MSASKPRSKSVSKEQQNDAVVDGVLGDAGDNLTVACSSTGGGTTGYH